MDEKRTSLLQAMGYPDKAINYILNKTNVGEISQPSVSAKHQGTCGDVMILHLLIQKEVIMEAKYDYIGCSGLQAAASAITEMVMGLSLMEASKIQAQDVLDFLGGLPAQKHECALLASNTLKKALDDYRNNRTV